MSHGPEHHTGEMMKWRVSWQTHIISVDNQTTDMYSNTALNHRWKQLLHCCLYLYLSLSYLRGAYQKCEYYTIKSISFESITLFKCRRNHLNKISPYRQWGMSWVYMQRFWQHQTRQMQTRHARCCRRNKLTYSLICHQNVTQQKRKKENCKKD